MKRLIAVVLFAGSAYAADKSLTVLSASVVVTGGDWQVTADGGCESITRIAPIAAKEPSQVRPLSEKTCKALKADSTANAKKDQRVE